MALVTLAQARAQCRAEPDYPADQLEPYMQGAEDAAMQYLNRAVYETQSELDTARADYAANVAAAHAAYDAAVEAAEALTDPVEKQAAICAASVVLEDAMQDLNTGLHGIVVNASIIAAVLLTIGHLFANREDVVAGVAVNELPMGARTLLRAYRRVMMP